MVAKSKKEARGLTQPTWSRGGAVIAAEVEPTDRRYRRAADNPGSIVLTVGNTEFGDAFLIPVNNLSAEGTPAPVCCLPSDAEARYVGAA